MTDQPQTPSGTDRFGTVRAGRVRRTVPVVGFAARAAGGRVVAGLRNRTGDPDAIDRFHQRTAERYADMLGHSKGVLMKAGQLMSTYDVDAGVGPLATYQAALQRLQSDAPPMDLATTRGVVEADLGGRIEDLFDEFSPEPIAAASIGQVHTATLTNGQQVAVKVQYPGVARAIRDDLANTELLATFLKLGMALTPRAMRTDQRSAAAEIAERIAEELDYRHEARSIRRFADLYRGHPFIRVPDVFDSHSGDRVLTMTFLEGVGWADARRADQHLRNSWAEAIGYFGFGAYRHSNLFNADPHPGNYRFGDDGTVGFVDFGCVKQFPEWVRRGIVTMFRATCDGDRHELYRLMLDHGFITPDTDLDIDDAFQWWAMMASSVIAEQPHTFVPADSTGLMQSMFDDGPIGTAVRKMQIPSDYVMLARINLGINAILSELGATLDTRDQLDCVDGVGEPRTPAGRAHVAWVRERGLPFGLAER
ncbi:ABC1 kinase family protein [Gordonia terrae]|uniref:ABC1 kinase family protein n=1 Tax=Gordonia terrae TaxID=2055 RepID=UPI003F6A8C58